MTPCEGFLVVVMACLVSSEYVPATIPMNSTLSHITILFFFKLLIFYFIYIIFYLIYFLLINDSTLCHWYMYHNFFIFLLLLILFYLYYFLFNLFFIYQ